MNNEACQKAFDKIAVDKCYDLTPGLEMDFFFDRTQNAWEGFQAAYNLRLSVEEIKAIAQVHMVDNWANVPDSSDIELLSQAIFDAQEAKS